MAAHQSQLFAWPDVASLEHGSRVEPMAVALRAIAEARPRVGDNALVIGVGPIGLHLIIGLRAAGAGTIVAVGRSSAGRRGAAMDVGADVVLDSREIDPAEYVRDTGVEIAQAYECAGDRHALNTCIQALRPGGTIVGVALGTTPSEFDTHRFVASGVKMVSACAYGNTDFADALRLVGARPAEINRLISERLGLEAAPDAFRRLRTPGDLVSILVQPWRAVG